MRTIPRSFARRRTFVLGALGSKVFVQLDWRPDPEIALLEARDDRTRRIRKAIEVDDFAICDPKRVMGLFEHFRAS